ncbi:MAG: aminoacyl-tRNA hydrolase [Candidatus Competibacteraceae bacterium]|nr:aminoacyl-tRNA hydrolase [Candidatus Competibacteraceae bacterium]
MVGLGNPGPQYQDTRHNAGFWFVDQLARHYGGSWRLDNKFGGQMARIRVSGQELWLLKPMGFMNRSGLPVARLRGFYKIPLEQVLVAHDELDLPPGTVRLKRGGGHGGHNGLGDIIRHGGGNAFIRLRIGIGHPGTASQVVGYVLRKAPVDEQKLIERAIEEAVAEFHHIVEGQLEKAMNALHSRRPPVA